MKKQQQIIYLLFFALGLLTTQAQMTIGDVKIGQGVTSPSDWVDYNTTGIYVDVNTSSCGFTSTPHYIVTLESISNKGYHWYISGVPSIYNRTPTGFRVYVRWTDAPSDLPTVGSLNFANPLRASTALDRDWVIRWTAIEIGDCSSCGRNIESRIASDASVTNGPFGNEEISEKSPIIDATTDDIKLFPNPGNSSITIQHKEHIQKFEIYTMQSTLLMTSKSNVLNIEHLPSGNYILKMYTENDILTKQFTK